MRKLILIIFFSLALTALHGQNRPWIYKSTKIDCVSGNCKNGFGKAVILQKYKREGDPTPRIISKFLIGNFKDGKLNGQTSIIIPANSYSRTNTAESRIKEFDKTIKAFKKLDIPTSTKSFIEIAIPFKVEAIVDGLFKNDTAPSLTYYNNNWLNKHGINKRPSHLGPSKSAWFSREVELRPYEFKNEMLENGGIIYSHYSSTIEDLKISPIDSMIVFLANGGTYKKSIEYKTIKIEDPNDYRNIIDYDIPVTSVSELKINDSIVQRIRDHELGWDLVISTHNGQTKMWRELNVYFANDVEFGRGDKTFSFPSDQNNYAEFKINDTTSYKGGTNGNNIPHGFGVMTTTVKVNKNDSPYYNSIFTTYQQYSGYFYNGKKIWGRNFQYSVSTDKASGDTNFVRWDWEHQGKFRNDKPYGFGKYITYQGVDWIKEFYDGTWYANRNVPYPNRGRYYYLVEKHNQLIPFNTRHKSGSFDEKGVYVSTAPPGQYEAHWYDCYPKSTIVSYQGKQALVIGRDDYKRTLTLSDGRTTDSNPTITIVQNADPYDYMCTCQACNGLGYYTSTSYSTDVDSYNKQDFEHINYLGLNKVTTSKITNVTHHVYQIKNNCKTCGGSGKDICK